MILQVPIASLKANPSNPRILRDEKFERLKKSLTDFPDMLNYRTLVAVTDTDGKYMVLGGNMRLRALQDLKIKEVPVMLADHWTEEQRREFAIKDNASFGDWDWEELYEKWDAGELAEWGLDVPEGFGEETSQGLTDPDNVPVVPVAPTSRPGDLWLFGDRHRILCGDSTKPEDVSRLMDGVKAACVLSDPPYGIGSLMHGGTWARKQGEKLAQMREWDARTEQKYFDGILSFGIPCVIWGGNYFVTPPSRCWLVWNKPEFPTMSSAELAWTNIDANTKRIDCSRTHQSDGAKEHATQKPIEVMKWSLGFLPDGIVLDPFVGSGTTIIAAEMTGRHCRAMEIAPNYVDVAVKRWQDFTGKKAIHAESGKTFDELSEAQLTAA